MTSVGGTLYMKVDRFAELFDMEQAARPSEVVCKKSFSWAPLLLGQLPDFAIFDCLRFQQTICYFD